MKCPKCNSENVQVQSKEYKPKLTVPIIMICGGIGLMFFGVGAIVGVIVGAIIAAIVNSVIPQTHQSVMVCQDCGYVSKPMNQPIMDSNKESLHNPLFCTPEESNLDVVRNDVDKGTIVVIRVKVDDYPHFDIGDNSTKSLKVPEGVHTVSYEQINGIGRNKNKGQLSVTVSEKQSLTISFTRQGLIVK